MDVGTGQPTPSLTSREWLSHEYVENERTTRDIARELSCNQATVVRALSRLGIPARSPGRKAGEIAAVYSDMAKTAEQIMTELTAQIEIDRKRYGTELPSLDKRKAAVDEAMAAGEPFATSRFRIEVAAAAVLGAEADRRGIS